MEQVLDAYCAPASDDEPLIAMDESCKELHGHEPGAEPLPPAPGRPMRQDHHYVRNGTAAIFLFFNPLSGWRRVEARESRTRYDWAEEVAHLLEVDYPEARRVRLVCDNLNTHHIGSLYAAFPAERAHALAARLVLIYTPRHGSWLNVAEIELSVLGGQCLERRIGDLPLLQREVKAWEAPRNAAGGKVVWRFTTADARIKLRHLYPQV
jgi:hypothetical protein